MKIAVLYSGFLRSWDHCRLNHEVMLTGGQIDNYFYTTERPYKTKFKQFVQDYSKSYYPEPLDTYNSNKNPITQLNGTLNQWISNFVSFNLVPTDYDVYVRARPDIEISAKIDFSDYDLKDNTVYILSGNDHCGGVNDQFAFGNYQSMKKYFSVYTDHHKLFERGLTFHTEAYVTENLKAKGVEIIRIPQTTTIIRDWVAVKRNSMIISELPAEHWRMLNCTGKKVLDLGAGRQWQNFPNTIEYFLEQGASSVVGVEMSPSEEEWYGVNVPAAKIFTDRIDSTEKLKRYLGLGAEVVKIDIEGAEAYLADIGEYDLRNVEQMAVEYHDTRMKIMLEMNYELWGFNSIELYDLHDFDSNEQGVIYLKK